MKFIAVFLLFSATVLSGETQTELHHQASEDAARADKELNDVYKLLMSKMAQAEKENLRKAQRLWIQFRDTQCKFEYEFYMPGSIAPMIACQCHARMTKTRIKELREMLYGYH